MCCLIQTLFCYCSDCRGDRWRYGLHRGGLPAGMYMSYVLNVSQGVFGQHQMSDSCKEFETKSGLSEFAENYRTV